VFYFVEEVVVRNVGVGFVPIISYVAITIPTGKNILSVLVATSFVFYSQGVKL